MPRLAILVAMLAVAGAASAKPIPTVLHISSHLPKTARASIDGGPAKPAPGYGSVNIPITAGRHIVRVVTAAGASYQLPLDLAPAKLLTWRGRGYWCINLLDHAFEVYSHDDCQEEVTEGG